MANIIKKQGAYLPHWFVKNGIYAVRFRLADSVPQQQLREWLWEREGIIENARKQKRSLSPDERRRVLELHSEKIDRYLLSGHGACWMQRDDAAEIVASALRFFDAERYTLLAWCVMSNHVHVILQPRDSFSISSILQSWKGFTARKINELVGRSGNLWQRESFDRLIRNMDHLQQCIEYVWSNPEGIGRSDWRWRWRMEPQQLEQFLKGYTWPLAAMEDPEPIP